jgi:hypothetical protein
MYVGRHAAPLLVPVIPGPEVPRSVTTYGTKRVTREYGCPDSRPSTRDLVQRVMTSAGCRTILTLLACCSLVDVAVAAASWRLGLWG